MLANATAIIMLQYIRIEINMYDLNLYIVICQLYFNKKIFLGKAFMDAVFRT